MNSLLHKIFTFTALILLVCSSVHADWYIGADVSEKEILPLPDSLSDHSLTNTSSKTDSTETYQNSMSLYGGYQTTDNFSLQLEYHDDLSFGIDDMFAGSSLWFPETHSDNFDTNAVFLSGISSYPLSENGVLYMKGGLFNWEIDSNYYEASEKYLGRSRGTDIFYGLGANYNLNARFGISAEWERYQMDESDIDYLSTKLKFKF